jgi:hypothetical protein
VRSVRLTVIDSSGKRTTVRHDVIVAPPTAFMAGAGSFMSPPHAGKADPGLSGPASFAFLVGYDKYGRAPHGTMLRFSLAGLDFHGTQFDSQAVTGNSVQYRGSGSLNGQENHQFALTVMPRSEAGGKDRVGLKIWHLEPGTNAEAVDYDCSEGAVILHGGLAAEPD